MRLPPASALTTIGVPFAIAGVPVLMLFTRSSRPGWSFRASSGVVAPFQADTRLDWVTTHQRI
jgi:hypothetical protein